jgi:hypothetical protein
MAMVEAAKDGNFPTDVACFDRSIEPNSMAQGGLYWSRSSVHSAIDLAICMSARSVTVHGVDYNDRSHFYTNTDLLEPDPKDNPGRKWDRMDEIMQGFEVLRKAMDKRGIRHFCSSNMSMLRWPLPPYHAPKPVARRDDKPTNKPAENPAVNLPYERYRFTKFFTFYTMDPEYSGLASRLVKSFRERGIQVSAIPFAKQKTWIRTCMARQEMMLSLSEMYSFHTCVFLDCDLELVGDPVLLEDFDGDVAVHRRSVDHKPEHLYSAGVVACRPRPAAREFLSNWAAKCRKDALSKTDIACREQYYLKEVVEAMGESLKPCFLPESYNVKPEHAGPDAVIIHDPASRKTLKGKPRT